MTREEHARKVPRWMIAVAIGLSIAAITRMLITQKSQRRALRDAALVSMGTGTAREREARVTVGPDGRAVVAWAGLAAGAAAADRVGLRALVKGSHAWGDAVTVRAPEPMAGGPALATTADGATWLAMASAAGHVYVTHAPAGTLDFAAPADALGADARVSAPTLAAAGQTAWLLAREERGPGLSRLVVRALGAHDAGASAPLVVTEGPVGAAPTVAANGPRVAVAWVDSKRGVVVSVADGASPVGLRFGADREHVVSEPDERVADEPPQCVVHGYEILVLYGLETGVPAPGFSPSLRAAVLTLSVDGGQTWARTRVEEPEIALLHPAMAREASGSVVLAYYAARPSPITAAALRWRRVPVVGGPADPAREARAPLQFAAGRDEPGWAGERISVVAEAGVVGVAFVDNLEGTRAAFVALGP